MYKYKTVGPNGKSNGANFLTLMSIKLGDDYQSWRKHPEYRQTLDLAHNHIFNESGIHRGGLRLRVEFLLHSETQPKATKKKRQCYNDTLSDALEAGIIDISKYKELVV